MFNKRNFNLGNESHNPYDVVDGIREEANEDIPLAVDLASVDFVEQSHHDKSIENIIQLRTS